jgi:hypothetical protein
MSVSKTVSVTDRYFHFIKIHVLTLHRSDISIIGIKILFLCSYKVWLPFPEEKKEGWMKHASLYHSKDKSTYTWRQDFLYLYYKGIADDIIC